ncbi:DUF2637 domain-containing protein [Streptomyces sp. NPDC048215]|uniref:DUF2637 domain-containing protein n=1 Tax=Streptomyces sp. NPDC048215 TaxID=3156690 RepID=UPI0033D397BE
MSTTVAEELPDARTAPPPVRPTPPESAVTENAAPEEELLPLAEGVPASGHRGLMIPIAVLAVLAGLAAAVTGFALSYGALRAAAVEWGYADGWKANTFPIAVDGLIVALYCADLILAWRGMARPWVRMTAHAFTVGTIVLNAAAAAGTAPGSPGLLDALQQHPARLAAHAFMPMAYVILTEVARWAIVRTARLESGALDDDRLSLADWVLRLPTTWAVFRHAKTWPSTYGEARAHVRELAIYRVWLEHREEIEKGLTEGQVGVLDRLPALLAPYGVSVKRARAIPDEMREREREQQEARTRADRERADREAREAKAAQRRREQEAREEAHADRMAALATEAAEARQEGEVAKARAIIQGETRATEAEAEAMADTAAIRAHGARTDAERAATEAQRRAETEQAVEESARTAGLRRQAAEDNRRAAEAEDKAARLAHDTQRVARMAAEEQAETIRLRDEAIQQERRLVESENQVAVRREEGAAARIRATLAEDALNLSDRDRRVRRVAWMVARAGDPTAVPLYEIEQELGVTNGAASGYRRDAAELIRTGYDYQTDPLHAIYNALHAGHPA